MLIGFSQTAGDARAFAAKHRYQIDINQESVAQAAANIGAGVLQGMPVSTSLSASSLNDHSGRPDGPGLAHVRRHGAADAARPRAVVLRAAEAGSRRADHRGGRDGHDGPARDAPDYRVQRFDFWVAVAAIVGTLAFGVLAGVVIGIGLSLLWLVRVATHPQMPILGREPGTQVFRDVFEQPRRRARPRRGRGAARRRTVLRDRGRPRGPGPRPRPRDAATSRASSLDCEGINFLDSQGSAKLSTTCALLCDQAGVALRLARVKPGVRAVLEHDGLVERLGADHIHGNVHRAVAAHVER